MTQVPQIEIPPGQKGSLRIDWSEWAKRACGIRCRARKLSPNRPAESGARQDLGADLRSRVRDKSGGGHASDELLAVGDEPKPQPPAPAPIVPPRVELIGITYDQIPKTDAWQPNGQPIAMPEWVKAIREAEIKQNQRPADQLSSSN